MFDIAVSWLYYFTESVAVSRSLFISIEFEVLPRTHSRKWMDVSLFMMDRSCVSRDRAGGHVVSH